MSDKTTIQLWPSGHSITYAGDYSEHAPAPTVYPSDWADTTTPSRPATPEEHRAIRVNERARGYLQHEVYRNMTALVDDLRKLQYEMRGDLADGFSDENIANLTPDPGEWDAAQCRAWLEDHGCDLPNAPTLECPVCHDATHPTCAGPCGDSGRVPDPNADEDDDYVDALRDAVRDNAELEEVYEWYLVSEWLGRKLAAIGECVLDSGYGVFWGRTCTGQAVIMDGTLQRVAELFEEGVPS